MTYIWNGWKSWGWSGHCTPWNTRPVACDDRAKVCANERVTIDVLRNDYDKQDSKADLTIKILGAVGSDGILDKVGEKVTLANGATVTLAKGNKLVYESGDAFDSLRLGEKAVDTFKYTVIDRGGLESKAAKVAVTVCGATDTLEEIAESLPTTLSITITDENVPAGVSDEAFTVSLSGSGDSRFDGLTIAEAYCLAAFDPLVTGTPITVNVYLADEDSVPAGALSAAAIANLDLVNWILNQDFGSKGYTDAEIQGAIWGLTDNIVFVAPGGGSQAKAQEIVALAQDNGEGFEVGDGDVIGLLVDPTDAATASTGHRQPFILAIEFDDLVQPCDCASTHWC